MTISFDSKELRLVCENQDLSNEKFGAEVSNKLQDRLFDLMAANGISEILLGKPTTVEFNNQLCYKIHLHGDTHLFLQHGHAKPPLRENQEINWNKVTRLKVLAIQ